jgi:LPS export ABC transporter protein LptC
MSWRWISLTALLAAFVIAYGALNGRNSSPVTTSEAPPQPGYYLKDAVITETKADGSMSMQLIAQRIEQHPQDDTITMNKVRVHYYQSAAKPWALSAQRGSVPANSRVVQLEGDVELRPLNEQTSSQPHAAGESFLRADSMAIDTEKNFAYSTSSPVRMKFGPHAMTVRSFRADLNNEKLRLESVNGQFAPP